MTIEAYQEYLKSCGIEEISLEEQKEIKGRTGFDVDDYLVLLSYDEDHVCFQKIYKVETEVVYKIDEPIALPRQHIITDIKLLFPPKCVLKVEDILISDGQNHSAYPIYSSTISSYKFYEYHFNQLFTLERPLLYRCNRIDINVDIKYLLGSEYDYENEKVILRYNRIVVPDLITEKTFKSKLPRYQSFDLTGSKLVYLDCRYTIVENIKPNDLLEEEKDTDDEYLIVKI